MPASAREHAEVAADRFGVAFAKARTGGSEDEGGDHGGGEQVARPVVAASQALFGRGDLRELDAATLDAAMAEVPTGEVRLADEPTIVELLVAGGLVESKGAARRTVKEGGAYVNNTKITEEDWKPEPSDVLHGHWLVVRRGKRTLAGVRVLN